MKILLAQNSCYSKTDKPKKEKENRVFNANLLQVDDLYGERNWYSCNSNWIKVFDSIGSSDSSLFSAHKLLLLYALSAFHFSRTNKR